MKKVKPRKLIINFDDKGKPERAILQYRMRNNDKTNIKFNTIAIDLNNLPGLNKIIQVVFGRVKQQENADGVG